MGCLCPKSIKPKNINDLSEQLNESPAPNEKEDLEANHITIGLSKYQDISQKRKMAEYLLSNDYGIFKRHTHEVKNLNDEDFNELFEGNTEYNYNVSNKKDFNQIAQKFDDNKELVMEYYDKEKYYEWVLQIWRPNILYQLKMENDDEKQARLKKHKIDISKWDDTFREYFTTIIDKSPIKSMAERMRNYIAADYGTFDELIKNVRKSRKNIEKKEKTRCNENIGINLDSSMESIIKDFVPKFLKSISNEIGNFPKNFKEKEKEKAFNTIEETVWWSESKKKKLIEQVKNIYEKDSSSNSGIFSESEEFEELKNLSKKFNEENLDDIFLFDDDEGDEDVLEFKGLTAQEKAKTVLGNKTIKHAILGLSMANLGYSVGHLCQTFMTSKGMEFSKKFEEIKNNFEKHQKAVNILDFDSDVDKALKLVGEWGANFEEDLEAVQNLMKEIEEQINNTKNEKNKTTLNIIGSITGAAIGTLGFMVTEGEDRFEYATSSFANIVSLCANCSDYALLINEIKKIEEIQRRASDLEKEIIKEIDKLKKKFKELSTKHY